jgi:hypothetical protein
MRKHLVNASPRHHVPAKKDPHGSANRLYRDGFTRTRVLSSTGRRERNGLGGLLVGLARAETSAFIQSGQRRLGNQMLAGLAFDVSA